MSLKETIDQQFKEALKNKDPKKDTLTLIRAAIKQVEVDQRKELKDEDVIKILKTEAKKRNDSITAYQQGGRQDLAAKEQAELKIIENYLPAQLNPETIRATVKSVIGKLGSSSQLTGKIMGAIMAELKQKGDVDGKLVQQIVKEEMVSDEKK